MDSIPAATVARLPVYLRCLNDLPTEKATISSDELADLVRVNAAKLRKDLSYLGSYGTRGVGYDVDHLRAQIGLELGLSRSWRVAIVGTGNLGRALAGYKGFTDRGFDIEGLFDDDPKKVGKKILGRIIEPLDDLDQAVAERKISIGLIATPAAAAQEVADRLVAAGVSSILNFAPVVLSVPDGIEVRRVDLSVELQILSHYMQRQLLPRDMAN
ncbi:MAG: redox-sensing transcriptional repressor Rex [Acidimicrobiia bacterium]|nr:redox-sensing transcriptional repressor Rex [Acidimicrobiia bacterium]MBT8249645.1 redox-sensing transcriptional repressor Rex [Acidimicrobiia bacterium]NNC42171.1 redox-sensing transcriptional repressor Rex [Acidimicrobiia bacterium]NNL27818.1 redox-sensing transcriptional repressor Rex [Acidimicrobiia bacterium]NNL47625.1 redox-sensing transcriptional repressor Rex [Acidimicrobiia bacterium]